MLDDSHGWIDERHYEGRLAADERPPEQFGLETPVSDPPLAGEEDERVRRHPLWQEGVQCRYAGGEPLETESTYEGIVPLFVGLATMIGTVDEPRGTPHGSGR